MTEQSLVLPPANHQGPRNDDAEQEPSIYEPLLEGEYLRVLKLHPGKLADEIHCSLVVVNFESSKRTYEASSRCTTACKIRADSYLYFCRQYHTFGATPTIPRLSPAMSYE
jgi:hypothetical protein